MNRYHSNHKHRMKTAKDWDWRSIKGVTYCTSTNMLAKEMQ